METLHIQNTERLQFRCGKTDYDHLFDEVLYVNKIIQEIKDMTDLSQEEMKAALERKIKEVEAAVGFIETYVSPKVVDPNVTAVVYAETHGGKPVGRVVLNHLGTKHPTIDIRVLPEKQHQGYGTEMLRPIISAAFKQGLADHLEYDVLTSNVASLRLVRKLEGQLVFANESGEMYEFYPSSDAQTE